jgi:hypothetical protein
MKRHGFERQANDKMKTNVFVCRWKHLRGKFKVWLESDDSVCAEARSLGEASDELADTLSESLKSDEAVIELIPPPPFSGAEKSWTLPRLLSLGYNEFAETTINDPVMYSRRECPRCGRPRGKRTDIPILLKSAIKGDIAATNSSPVVRLFSDKFLALLTPNERSRIRFEPVQTVGERRMSFFELRGDSIAPWVSFKGAKHPAIICWKCPACGNRKLNPQHPKFLAFGFISRTDFTNAKSPECFVAGSPEGGLTICMTERRWKSIVGKVGTKGIATSTIALVDDKLLVRNPPLLPPPA